MCYLPSFSQWGRGLSTVLVVQVWRETECASQLVNDRAGNTVPSFLFFLTLWLFFSNCPLWGEVDVFVLFILNHFLSDIIHARYIPY